MQAARAGLKIVRRSVLQRAAFCSTCTVRTPSTHSCSFLGMEDLGSEPMLLKASVSAASVKQRYEQQRSSQDALAVAAPVLPYALKLQTIGELVPAHAHQQDGRAAADATHTPYPWGSPCFQLTTMTSPLANSNTPS
jgi:hypothetical protein